MLGRLYPRVPDLPWATGAIAVLLSVAGGVLLLAYGRLSRHWGRALLVRFKRRIRRREVDRLLAERREIFAQAEELSRDLDLPGRVGAGGRIETNLA